MKINRLENYIEKVLTIDTAKTYMIRSEKTGDFAYDEKALEEFHIKNLKDFITGIAAVCKEYNLRLGIAERQFSKRTCYLPVLCAFINGKYHHIAYRSQWRCRDCGTWNDEVFEFLADTGDGIFYENRFDIKRPEVFRKLRCKNCGHLLQGYLLPANELPVQNQS